MRELRIAIAALWVAAAFSVRAEETHSLKFKNGKKAADGVDVLAYTAEGPKPLGTTDAGGVLAGIDPSFFTMKPHGSELIVRECDGEQKTYLNFSDASEDGVCKGLSEAGSERSCKCKALGLWMWGKDVQIGSSFPTLYVAGGGAAGAAAVLLASGGSESSSTPPATPSSTPPVSTTPSAPTSFMRTYRISITRIIDPARHLPHTGQPPPELKVTVNGGSIMIEGARPWVTVNGSYNPANGAFSASGLGEVAGRPNIGCKFEGTIDDGTIRGTVVWGAHGGLPQSQPISFEVQGTAIS